MRFFRGGSGAIVIHHWSRSGAIDNPGLFEQGCDQYNIPEVPEKFHARLFDDLSSEIVHLLSLNGFYEDFYLLQPLLNET